MDKEHIERIIHQLDGIIATLKQAAAIGGRTDKESAALDLLQDARLKLLEHIEAQTGNTY